MFVTNSTYPVVFIECTFFQPDHKEAAASSLHLHWSDLRSFVLEHRDTTFVLIHFSRRYSDEEINSFFDKERELQRQKEAEAQDDPIRKPAFNNLVIWLTGLNASQ